ncbi:MAG: amidinotransferase [Chitinophagaceae bacterium]|nr:amidinotransferase [Chitinophagaceae bacterium]
MQTTSQILMIRPVNFSFNAETAVNNSFQIKGNNTEVQQEAEKEFDLFVTVLRAEGVQVTVVDDTPHPYTPDSLFPNNWVSFHEDGTVFLYPMFAANRRLERKPEILQVIRQRFSISSLVDLSGLEEKSLFLEGTGSMVLDRESKIAYACLSPRTSPEALKIWEEGSGYTSITFMATDAKGRNIYHTNVMMCVADTYAVVCLDCVPDDAERKKLTEQLEHSGKKIVAINRDQMNCFAGNMLQVNNKYNEELLVMSSQAYNALEDWQTKKLLEFNRIVHSPLDTIERNGGGSARCMIAEVHLPVQAHEY